VTLHFDAFELRGSRVLLRPLAADDAAALASAAADSRASYAYTHVPAGVAEAQAYISSALQARLAGQRYPFCILRDGRIVGSTSFCNYELWRWPPGSAPQRYERPDVVEIGHTWLSASAQGTAVNTESKLLMLGHAFERWEVHRVCLCTDARNERSRRAIARLGMHFEGIRRAHKVAPDGTIRDSAFFSMLIEDWPAARAHLVQRLERPA
jgi:N-acetyltransferase